MAYEYMINKNTNNAFLVIGKTDTVKYGFRLTSELGDYIGVRVRAERQNSTAPKNELFAEFIQKTKGAVSLYDDHASAVIVLGKESDENDLDPIKIKWPNITKDELEYVVAALAYACILVATIESVEMVIKPEELPNIAKQLYENEFLNRAYGGAVNTALDKITKH